MSTPTPLTPSKPPYLSAIRVGPRANLALYAYAYEKCASVSVPLGSQQQLNSALATTKARMFPARDVGYGMKTRIYIETSVVSYLTSRPARDITRASHQASTRDLWDRLGEFDVYISELVVVEAAKGDTEAARLRLEALAGFDELAIDEDARDLAGALIASAAMPEGLPEDALHIAVAAVNGMHVVVTWNFKHINNPFTRMMIRQVVENSGCGCPEICSPEELLGEEK